MPTPDAIAASLKFRNQLGKEEAQAFARMGRLYARIITGLSDELQKLAEDIAAETVAAETVAVSRDGTLTVNNRKIKFARLQRILNQVQDQVTRFGGTVQSEVALAQALGVDLGAEAALDLMELSLPELPPEVSKAVTTSFARLPSGAIESAAGLLADDSPLMAKLSRDFGEAVRDQVESHLLEGMAIGRNPRVIARKLAKNLESSAGVGLKWAMTTVRTAQIKSYQTANHMTYAANPEIVPGWVWHSALDIRTCMSCVNQHGSEHPVTERLNDHHNGRCAPIPKAISYADLGLDIPDQPLPKTEKGEAWFKRQTEADQRDMMGAQRFEAWQKGEFDFRDLSQKYDDEAYGELLRETSLKSLRDGGRNGFVRPPTEPVKPPERERPTVDIPTPATPAGGVRVSEAANLDKFPKKGKLGPLVRETLNIIDSIHGDGNLTNAKIKVGNSSTTQGVFTFLKFGRDADSITISRKSNSPMLTMAHEVGHWLDMRGFTDTEGYSSAQLNATPAFKKLQDVMDNSEAIKALSNLRGKTVKVGKGSSGYDYRVDDRYLSFLLGDEERFARAYSQYIAIKSKNPVILAELDKSRNPTGPIKYTEQWSDEDFAPIEQAIDDLLKSVGWTK